MRASRLLILLACSLSLITVAAAQTTPKQALLVLSKTNHTLAIVSPATLKVVKRLPIGRGAAGVLMDPNGKRVYVSCGPDNDVAVIDLKALTVAGRVDAGGNPDELAWTVQH